MRGVFRDREPDRIVRLALALLRELNYLGLTAAYLAATVVLLFQRPRWRRILLVFAPPRGACRSRCTCPSA